MGFYGRKLVRRLFEENGLELPSDVSIRPCRPGWSTRSAGGFNWVFESKIKPWFGDVGSQYTVRECAMAPTLTVSSGRCGDTFIDPEDD